LILVFLGVLVGAYQPLVGSASSGILGRFKAAARWALMVFGVSLVSVILDTAWLAASGGHRLYIAALVVFFMQLAALALIACYSTIGVLLRG
jgi:hypothetical protein